MSSIRDVATLAKVSPATVSRVINGTANVDEEKRKRVLKVISDTGFVPNEVARSLFKKSAKIIGLILPSIENPFFTQLASAVEKTADANGYKVILCNTGGDLSKERSVFQMLSAMNADGIILTTSSEGVYECIENLNIPVVVTDRRYVNDKISSYVHSNHFECGKMAARHLVECGCKNIVCINGPQDISSGRERYLGYQDICREFKLTEQTVECDYDFEAGLKVSQELLNKYPKVDGIVACNDIVAISVYKVLHQKGIRVPQDIQLIGYDDINLASLVTPSLTTIAQPIEQIGIKAAELIINKDMPHEKEYVFGGKLVVRETTRN